MYSELNIFPPWYEFCLWYKQNFIGYGYDLSRAK